MLYVADKKEKNIIVKARNVEEGLAIIRDFEEEDRYNGCYTYRYYDIVTRSGKSVLGKKE